MWRMRLEDAATAMSILIALRRAAGVMILRAVMPLRRRSITLSPAR